MTVTEQQHFIARTLCKSSGVILGCHCDGACVVSHFEMQARAVMAALRHPTFPSTTGAPEGVHSPGLPRRIA